MVLVDVSLNDDLQRRERVQDDDDECQCYDGSQNDDLLNDGQMNEQLEDDVVQYDDQNDEVQ